MKGLTSEFGMDSGISPSLLPPGKLRIGSNYHLSNMTLENLLLAFVKLGFFLTFSLEKKEVVKPFDRLVLVSSTHYCAYTSNLSTL